MAKTYARRLTKRDHYAGDSHVVFEHRHERAPRNPAQVSEITFRRCIPTGSPEELQIEFSVRTFHEKRTTEYFGSLTLTKDDADLLAASIAQVFEKVQS